MGWNAGDGASLGSKAGKVGVVVAVVEIGGVKLVAVNNAFGATTSSNW